MGKPTGFLEYERENGRVIPPEQRIKNFKEFHIPLSRKLQRIQGARCMECGVPFCQAGMMIGGMASGCPLNNLVPEWNDLLYRGNWEQAVRRLLKTNSFPEFTSRVCPALCEAACTCGVNGQPVSTKENEYVIIEYGFESGLLDPRPPKVRTGKKVAVIGSGPAGLAAADLLNRRGHSVTVFERHDRVGGLLMYGIPNMKLDKRIVDRRVKLMTDEGVKFVTGADIGGDPEQGGISSERIMNEFDSTVLACGAANPRDINVPGREAKGIYFAVDFLTATTKSLLDSQFQDGKFIPAKDKKVMVIGGGDTGNDCVGTSIRLGAESVIQLEMMPKAPDERAEDNPWPMWPKVCKTDYGQEEAIYKFGQDPRIYETTVKSFLSDEDGNVCGAELVSLSWTKDPETGRMNMSQIEGSERVIPVDLVLIAAGFLGAQSYVTDAFGVNITPRTTVQTDAGKYATSVPNVYTAGDMHRGQSLVVWAIHEGRECARFVDKNLMGYTNLS